MSEDPNDISIPPNGRPDTEDGDRLRAAAALYRQIWGTDPEPRSEGASGLYPASRPRPTEHGAGDGLNGGPDLTGRVAELESRLEGLIPLLEVDEIEALGEHGQPISSFEKRLAALEGELREFTRSFNGRMDRVERMLHRFIDVSRKIATPQAPGPEHDDAFEH
jgi:hypothetical protein